MKKTVLFLLVAFFSFTSSYAGLWTSNSMYTVSEDGNMRCYLKHDNTLEVGEKLSKNLSVYTDDIADVSATITGDSHFKLVTASTNIHYKTSDYYYGNINYTFDATGVAPSATPYTATITVTRGDQQVSCTLYVTVKAAAPTAGPVLNGEFSVSETKKVKFTRGNLYWNGSDWGMELSQERTQNTWDPTHVGLFYWAEDAAKAVAEKATFRQNQLFCDGSDSAHKLVVEEAEDLYAMDKDQWDYLLFNRPNASRLHGYGVQVNDVYPCLIIAPDDYEGTIASYYTKAAFLAAQEKGLVCLPTTGWRSESNIMSSSFTRFQYWTSTYADLNTAYYLTYQSATEVEIASTNINKGYGIRLVQDVSTDEFCEHLNLHEIGNDRPTCTSYDGTYHDYVQCDECGAYFVCNEDGTTTRVEASSVKIPTLSEFHQGHLGWMAATATCYVDGYKAHRHCDLCDARYYAYTDVQYDPSQVETLIIKAPKHHTYEGGNSICTVCGDNAKYREVTSMRQLVKNSFYLIVAKAGDKYYALGMPKEPVSEYGIASAYEGYTAIPVKKNEDGTISIANNDVAQLFYTSKDYPLEIKSLNDAGGRSEKHSLIRTTATEAGFCDPRFGYVQRWGGPLDYVGFGEDNSVHYQHEGTVHAMQIYDGSDNYPDYIFDNYFSYPYIELPFRKGDPTAPDPDKGTLLYRLTKHVDSWLAYYQFYLGVNNDGTAEFRMDHAVEKYADAPSFDHTYPAHAYYHVGQTRISARNTTVGYGRGYISKADLAKFGQQAKAFYEGYATTQGTRHYNDYGHEYNTYVEKADYTLKTIDLSDAILADDITYADLDAVRAMDYVTDNAIFILPSNCAITGENIVKDGKSPLITLEDKGDFEIPVDVDIEAEEINYERLIAGTTHWGTLCLPFEVKSNNAIQLYQLKAVDEGSEGIAALTFTAIDKVEAGQPVVFHKKEPTAEGIFVSANEVKLSAGGVGSVNTNVDEWSMRGTFTATTIQSNVAEDGSADDKKRYYIGSDKFWGAKKTANVAPFRAWFEATEASGVKAANYIIVVDDEEETSILNVDAEGNLNECTEIYDLSGNKLTKAIKGQVNIINGKKIYIK